MFKTFFDAKKQNNRASLSGFYLVLLSPVYACSSLWRRHHPYKTVGIHEHPPFFGFLLQHVHEFVFTNKSHHSGLK